jgi:hypothetical protein
VIESSSLWSWVSRTISSLGVWFFLAFAVSFAHDAKALDVPTMNSPSTIKLYVSGSESAAWFIQQFWSDSCASDVTLYRLQGQPEFATIYTCTAKSGSPPLGGVRLAIQKRNAGDSVYGVAPVANSASIDFIDPSSCVAPPAGSNEGTCTGFIRRVPDMGLSDLEPSIFEAPANRPPSTESSDVAALSPPINLGAATVRPFYALIYGIAVSQPLYNKLQVDQGLASTNRPSIPHESIALLLSSWSERTAWRQLLPRTRDGTDLSQVTICRGTNGSGVQAAANAHFLQYPFNSSITLLPLTRGDSTTQSQGSATGQLYVREGTYQSTVRSCLEVSGAVGGYAIGLLTFASREPAPGALWKFVSINGRQGGWARRGQTRQLPLLHRRYLPLEKCIERQR